MKLDISNLRSDFKIVEESGLRLIVPKKNMWDWNDNEKWFRSVVIDKDNNIVSCSWPKFGNYGEFLNDTEILNQNLKSGVVRYTTKIDGSLCIRYVYNGNVYLRTRGTLFGGEAEYNELSYGERFKNTASKYPKILDPNWMCDRSLLFEYVAPSNLIVVRYKEEDLIFLGFVLNELKIGSWEETEVIAKEANLNLVTLNDLPRTPKELLEEIRDWKEEGIVARCNGDQTFVKIKSAFYLANHRMKYSMTYDTMVEYILGANIVSEQQLEDALRKCDYDWEIIDSAKEFYRQYVVACSVRDDVFNEARVLIENFNKQWPLNEGDPRQRKKEFAVNWVKDKKRFFRSAAFLLYDGNENKLNSLGKKIILNKGEF